MANKAVFKGKYVHKMYNDYAVDLFYEYRGHEYMITDERNGYSEPLWVKHKNEQERIDKLIERENKPNPSSEDAQVGFDLFWDYVNS